MSNATSDLNDELSISFFQKYVDALYYGRNQNKPVYELYIYLYQASGNLSKSLSVEDLGDEVYIKMLSWLFVLSSRLGIDLQESYFKKYPGICPFCLEPQCVCYKTHKRPQRPIPAYKMREEMYFKYETIINSGMVLNLDNAVKNINRILAVNEAIRVVSGSSHLVFRIYEEIAEVTEVLSGFQKGEKPLDAVGDEIADVFAWILYTWSIVFPAKSLDESLIAYYYQGCPLCKSYPCLCIA